MKGLLLPLLCAALAASLFSCKNPVMEERKAMMPPDSLIPEPVMVQLLADVHLLEAGLLNSRNRNLKTAGLSDVFYQDLYVKYGISEARYRQNLTYYQWDPEVYTALYGRVIDELRIRNSWLPAKDTIRAARED
jgi:hypothetical protein